jgi:hypothetical protein
MPNNGIESEVVKSLLRNLQNETSNFVSEERIKSYSNGFLILSSKNFSKTALSIKIRDNNNYIQVLDKQYNCLAENLQRHYEEKFDILFGIKSKF